MSDILRRIIEAQKSDENPFFKDAEGRIIEITALQGEVFTGYYQAESDVYYTERDWLELQRQLELDRIAEAEYQAEQKRLAAERAERDRKRKEFEARIQKEEAINAALAKKPKVSKKKKYVAGILLVLGIIILMVVFWPIAATDSKPEQPDITVVDTIQNNEQTTRIFGNAIITGNDVRMRAEPDLKGKIVTFFPEEGERVEIIKRASDSLNWAQVRRENGTTGWVFGDYVKEK